MARYDKNECSRCFARQGGRLAQATGDIRSKRIRDNHQYWRRWVAAAEHIPDHADRIITLEDGALARDTGGTSSNQVRKPSATGHASSTIELSDVI